MQLARHSLFSMFFLLACGESQVANGWTSTYIHTLVPFARDNNNWYLIVDTGTPRTQISPELIAAGDGYEEERPIDDFDVMSLYSGEPLLVSGAFSPAVLRAQARGELTRFGGILGVDLLAKWPFVIDIQASQMLFADAALAAISEHDFIDAPVELLGGGLSCFESGTCVENGRSRMIVPITVGQDSSYALLDTGASFVTTSLAVFDDLARAQPEVVVKERVSLDGGVVQLGRFEVQVGEIHARVAVLGWAGMGASLSRLQVETGRRVEYLLGHSFLSEFRVAVDYGRSRLAFAEYEEPSGLFEMVGVGALVIDDGECFRIDELITDGPAAQAGLFLGQCLSGVAGLNHGEASVRQVLLRMEESGLGDSIEFQPTSGESIEVENAVLVP